MLIDYLAGKILTGVFMLICAACDIRENKIDIRIFGIMLFAELCGYIGIGLLGAEIDFVAIAAGAASGILIWMLSRITNGSIGTGDAIFFGLTGVAMGGLWNALLFIAGLAVCAIYALILAAAGMMRGRPVRNQSFAMLPMVFPVGILLLILRR